MAEIKKINTELQLESALRDASGSTGTSGQILSSTGTVTDWVTLSEIQGVDGSGTANYISKWSDSDTITDSLLYDDGTQVLIGATSSVFSDDLYINNAAYSQGGWRVGTTTTYVGKLVNSAGVLSLDADGTRSIGFRNGTNGDIVRIDGVNSRVGIGTTSPIYPFSLESDGTGLMSRMYNTNADGQGLLIRAGATTSATRVFQAASSNDTKIMTVNSNGRVGIGTTTPSSKLDVNGDIKIGADSSVFSDGSVTISIDYNNNQTDRVFNIKKDNSTELFRVQENGNVGIGTTSPGASLHVASVTNDYVAKFSHTTATGYAPGSILLQAGQSVSRGQGLFHYNTEADESWFTGVPYSVNSRKWIVANKPDTTFNPDVAQLSYALLTIDSDTGNVGIGNTSPLSKLQVNKYTVASQGNQTVSGELSVFADSGDDALFLGTRNSAYPDRGWSFSNSIVGVNANLQIKEYGLNGTRVTIQSGGNVGIGTTNPGTKLHVGTGSGATVDTGYQAVIDSAGIAGLQILSGANWSGRIVFGDSNDNDVGMIRYDHTDNSMRFVVNGSASERMRIDSSGNVGIGTTAPGTKLDIVGGIQFDKQLASNNYNGSAKAFIHVNSGSGSAKFKVYKNTNTTDGYAHFVIDRAYDYGNNDQMIQEVVYQRRGTTKNVKFKYDGDVTTSDDVYLEFYELTDGTVEAWICHDDFAYGAVSITYFDNTGDTYPEPTAGTPTGTLIHSTNPDTETPNWDSYQGSGYFSGNVGIGTTSPGEKLDVAGTARMDTGITEGIHYVGTSVEHWGDGGTGMQFPANDTISLKTASSDRLYINSSGNVGIGTTSPSTKLHLYTGTNVITPLLTLHNSTATNGSTAGLSIDFVASSDAAAVGSRIIGTRVATGAHMDLRFHTRRDNFAMIIDEDQNVGIGTTSPSEKLQVSNGDIMLSSSYALHLTTTADHTKIQRSNNGLELFTNSSVRMHINDSGDVGIGTSSPSEKLHVVGNGIFTGEATVGDKLYLTNVSSSGADGILAFDSTNTSGGSRIFSFTRGSGNSLKYHSYGYHLWQSGPVSGTSDSSNRMILDSSGRLGIGTTSPTVELEVNGDIKSQKDIILPFNQTGTVTTAMGAYKGGYTITMPESSQMAGNPYFMSDLAYFTKKGGTVTVTGLTSSLNLDTVFRPDAGIASVNASSYTGNTFTIELSDVDDVSNLLYGARIGIAFGSPSFMPSSMLIEYSTDSGTNYTTALNSSKENHFYYTYAANGGSSITNIKFTIGLPFYSNVNQIRITNIFSTDYAGDGMKNYFVPVDGGSYYGDVSFKDNKILRFGDGNDLKIYHNGSDSYIDEVGTGNLIIRSNSQLVAKTFTGETMFKGIVSGAFEAYYDNVKKFETTSSGVYVGGSIGNIGTNIGQQLEVGDSSLTTLRFDADAWRVFAGGTGSSGEALRVTETGDVGIGQTSPVARLDIVRSGPATNGTTTQGIKVNSTRGGWANTTLYGLNSIAEVNGRIGATDVFGVRGIANYTNDYSAHTTTVNQGSLIGLYSEINLNYVAGEAPINLAFGVKAGAPTISTSSHLENYFGVYVEEPVVNGSLTNKYAIVTEANAGNVGIGTITPSKKLHVNGAVLADDYRGSTHIYLTSPDSWIFRSTGGSTRMQITSAGNVGIGTTFPSKKLHVNGTGLLVTDGNETGLSIDNGSYVYKIGDINGGENQSFMSIDSANQYTYFNNTNVGVGLSQPSSKLHVSGGDIEVQDSSNGLILRSPNGTRYRITVDNSGNLTTTAI